MRLLRALPGDLLWLRAHVRDDWLLLFHLYFPSFFHAIFIARWQTGAVQAPDLRAGLSGRNGSAISLLSSLYLALPPTAGRTRLALGKADDIYYGFHHLWCLSYG